MRSTHLFFPFTVASNLFPTHALEKSFTLVSILRTPFWEFAFGTGAYSVGVGILGIHSVLHTDTPFFFGCAMVTAGHV